MIEKITAIAPIVTVARNNLDLLRRAVGSFRIQRVTDRRVSVFVVNNGSTDGTGPWLYAHPEIDQVHIYPQHGVAHAWNTALRYLFGLGSAYGVDRVLVCNQDVMLRPDTYALLAAEGAEFVTAVGSADRTSIARCTPPRSEARRPHPDFSCFMISRGCWERVGEFDEGFRGAYAEDCDFHCRLHRAGIEAYSIDLPFWHVGGGGQTIKRADSVEREAIGRQADANRAYFLSKWGFPVPTPQNGGREYYAFLGTAKPPQSSADESA